MEGLMNATNAALLLWMVAVLPAAAQQAATQPVSQLNMDAVPRLNTESIPKVKQLLKGKGFDPGRFDGIVGPLTRGFVSSFQEKYGIKSRGEIDNQTLFALGAVDVALSTKKTRSTRAVDPV